MSHQIWIIYITIHNAACSRYIINMTYTNPHLGIIHMHFLWHNDSPLTTYEAVYEKTRQGVKAARLTFSKFP